MLALLKNVSDLVVSISLAAAIALAADWVLLDANLSGNRPLVASLIVVTFIGGFIASAAHVLGLTHIPLEERIDHETMLAGIAKASIATLALFVLIVLLMAGHDSLHHLMNSPYNHPLPPITR